MMQKKVCLFSDHHISYNPRLWKEAFFWEKEGWDVTIVVMWVSEQSLERDQELLKGHQIKYRSFCSLIPSQTSSFTRFFLRLRKRISGELVKWFNIQLPWAISYAPEKLIRYLLGESFDLYSAHMECGFYAGRALVKKGKPVIFDFEDWYSHDYLVPERPVKLLEKVERFALHHGKFCTAASESMANALQQYYQSSHKPLVIYNGFEVSQPVSSTSPSETSSSPLRLLWFSRTIGSGRGLEKLMEALSGINRTIELTLLGETTEQFKVHMYAEAKGNDLLTLTFHPFLPHNQLHGFLQQFHIGLAIEENINSNKNLTVSNKILQYLQAGLKVLATDTEGQKEVQRYFPHRIAIAPASDTKQWAQALYQLQDSPEGEHQADNDLFNRVFSLDAQQQKFRQKLSSIFSKDNLINA